MNFTSILEGLFLTLPSVAEYHSPTSQLYSFLKQVARREIEKRFSEDDIKSHEFSPFGELMFPYYKMGAVDSLNLFDIDELIIFSFYWANRHKYRTAIDVGANIGLHSIILGKCGFNVHSYEPDPKHFEILQRNLILNNCSGVQVFNVAISSKAGNVEFVRVIGNTTGSHIAGSKDNPYGELERFPVNAESIESIINWADLIKIDSEGHEKEILLSTKYEHWLKTDAFVEIENEKNATAIYEYFKDMGINIFSQKNGWQVVNSVKDMPTTYRQGSIFITHKKKMPW